jgi:hypothetical protein
MPRVGFEPTIPVFERAKTFRALHSAASVTDGIILGALFIVRMKHPHSPPPC